MKEIVYLSDANEAELIVEEPEEYVETPAEMEEVFEGDVEVNTGLNKALDTYRKLIEKNEGLEPLTEKQQEALEKRIKEIESRLSSPCNFCGYRVKSIPLRVDPCLKNERIFCATNSWPAGVQC